MDRRLNQVRRTFIISIVGLVTATLVALTGTLLITNSIGYDNKVTGSAIMDLTRQYPEVTAYLDEQKAAEPHFETIATLVKQSQERRVAEVILIAALPLILASGLFGYVLAHRLLKPVEESYEAQERFIQDAAHELRNPLAAMSAAIEASKIKSTSSPSSRAELLERLERQTKRLISINEDLLFLQRAPEVGTHQNTNISAITKNIITELRTNAQDRKISIESDISAHCMANILARDYEIVLRNILDNAIKYSRPKSIVTVNVTQTSKEIILEVHDSGIGIPKDELPQITKRFYRGTNTREHSGTGLGMALVQKVITVYNANLDIRSTQDTGTTVQITFNRS